MVSQKKIVLRTQNLSKVNIGVNLGPDARKRLFESQVKIYDNSISTNFCMIGMHGLSGSSSLTDHANPPGR